MRSLLCVLLLCGCALADCASAATTVEAAVIHRPLFGNRNQPQYQNGCPRGQQCHPRPSQPSQPQQVDPPQFDMPPADVESVESGVPLPAAIGGLAVIAVVSGTTGAYRQFKSMRKK